ncbi:hypothetical protein B0H12DRAFT_1239806 [Mycena haematopus]|nr:hypothetical protein B0H12DRAFT_1239806 [Mycena haematopus]
MSSTLSARGQCTQCTACAAWLALDLHPFTQAVLDSIFCPRTVRWLLPSMGFTFWSFPAPGSASERHLHRDPVRWVHIGQLIKKHPSPTTLGIPNADVNVVRHGSLMPRQSLFLLTYFNHGVSLILAPVHRHLTLQAPAELSSQVPPQPQHPAALPAALRTGQPVMDAFSGVPAASERNVGTQRSESIAHSLAAGPFATLRGHSGSRRAYPTTPEEHQAWIISAFAVVLLGHHSPWSHPEFIALQEGFNLGQHFTESIRQQNARPFLVTLYDRRIRAVDDVITHLKYLNPLRPRKTSAYFVKLFQLRLKRYAHGRGHPNGVRCLNVTEEEFQLCRNDPLLRANLILRGGSDSDMRPMEPTWSINDRFLYCLSTYYSLTAPPVQVPRYWIQDVYLDLHLRDLLLEPLPMSPNRSTKFELWLHSQLLDRQHNTI